MRRQDGLALVIVLWVLSLLIIMAGSFALTMRREATVISAVKDNAQALAAAESGVAIAWQMIQLEDKNARWRADGSIYPVFYRDVEVRVRILSERGKIDINKADEELLRTLMQSTDADMERQQALVSAIIDWRDEDDLVYINGAEKDEYAAAGLAYAPANKAFGLLDELQMVLGMDNETYRQLEPLVTVYSGQAKVDLSVASKEVLTALGSFDAAMLEEYLRLRVENASLQLPPPPLPLENAAPEQPDGKGVYTVIAQAKLVDIGNAGIRAIIRKSGGAGGATPFEVLDWRQTYGSASLFDDEMEPLLVTLLDES